MNTLKRTLSTFALGMSLLILSSFEIPKGWFVAGSKPTSYNMGTDVGAGRDGKNCATIQSVERKIKGFGTLMQNSNPEAYFGKRLRMSGYVKSKDVKTWAGLWLRIDAKNDQGKTTMLGFDNMGKRKIRGTTDWTKYELVLDVPKEATNIAFGALLGGTGQIWFDDITFEIVDSTVATTNMLK
jgi:hypothetical protein